MSESDEGASQHGKREGALLAFLRANSAYAYIAIEPPEALVGVALKLVATQGLPAEAQIAKPSALLLAHLYRRMADLAWFTQAIELELRGANPYRAATISATLLTGYFGASKATLDAVAITLARTLELDLAPKQQDLAKEPFWKALLRAGAEVHAQLEEYRTFAQDVVKWRDAAVHRTTPFVIVHTHGIESRPPSSGRIGECEIMMSADPEETLASAVARVPRWMGVLAKPKEWRPKFEAVVEIAGLEIVRAAERHG